MSEEGSKENPIRISDAEAKKAEAPLEDMMASLCVFSPAGHTVSITFLLDSGSQVSLIPRSCIPAWAQTQKLATPRQINTAVASAAATYATEVVSLRMAPYPMRTPKNIMMFIADVSFPILGLQSLNMLGYELRRPALVDFQGPRDYEIEVSPTMTGLEEAEAKDEIMAHISKEIAFNQSITGPCTHPAAEYSIRIRPEADPTGNKAYVSPYHGDVEHATKDLRPEIEKMLNEGVIEECPHPSPHRLSFVAVRKKANKPGDPDSTRFCFNPGSLNTDLQKPTYPMHKSTYEIVQASSKGSIFSHLDLKSAFHSLPVHPDSRDYLVFRFEKRFYRYLRTPFGLADLPAHFSRLMEEIVANMDFVTFYIDDILVVSNSVEEHKKHLAQVLQALNKYNLKLNVDKCEFAVTKVKMLGCIITPNKISVDPEKVDLIRALLSKTQ